jgi:hypothetical protein
MKFNFLVVRIKIQWINKSKNSPYFTGILAHDTLCFNTRSAKFPCSFFHPLPNNIHGISMYCTWNFLCKIHGISVVPLPVVLPVFGVYKKVGDSGDAVIEKQGFSIVDKHEPAIATPLFLYPIDSYPHRNQIFLLGCHQEVRRFDSPGLHHITPVSSRYGMSRSERHTSTLFGSSLPSPVTIPILCHQQVFRTAFH